MMLTRCPACQTVFRLRPEQLHARRGEVRCGHCFHPFNAIEHALEMPPNEPSAAPTSTPEFLILEDKPTPPPAKPSPASMLDFGIPEPEPEPEPEPPFARGAISAPWHIDAPAWQQPDMPSATDQPKTAPPQTDGYSPFATTSLSVAAESATPANFEPAETLEPALPRVFPGVLRSGRRPAPLAEAPPAADAAMASATAPAPSAPQPLDTLSEPPPHEPAPLPAINAHDAVSHEPDLERLDATYGRPPRKAHPVIRALAWMLALALAALLGAQSAYLYRMEIARELPGLRPLLTEACVRARCTIPYPQDADRIAIEASDLQAEPGKPGHYLLHATLNNRAEYPQRWPHLELTLTDAGDNPISRRVLTPAEWLSAGQNGEAFPARKAVELRLPFEVPGLAPTGYRIYAFYP